MKKLKINPGFKGSNFMTPYNRQFFSTNSFKVELSEGTGLRRQPIFGVTILDNPEKSKLFQSEEQAMRYIRSL